MPIGVFLHSTAEIIDGCMLELVGEADGLFVGDAVGVRTQQFGTLLPQLLSTDGMSVAAGGHAVDEQ